MATYFREVKSIFLKAIIACLLTFIFVSQLFGLYAKEGDPCCDSNVCGFGYTCIAPINCRLPDNPGSCTKSQTQCSPGTLFCPPGQYCVDYICITLGPGTPTPGGGSYEYQRCSAGQALSCGTVAEITRGPRDLLISRPSTS